MIPNVKQIAQLKAYQVYLRKIGILDRLNNGGENGEFYFRKQVEARTSAYVYGISQSYMLTKLERMI